MRYTPTASETSSGQTTMSCTEQPLSRLERRYQSQKSPTSCKNKSIEVRSLHEDQIREYQINRTWGMGSFRRLGMRLEGLQSITTLPLGCRTPKHDTTLESPDHNLLQMLLELNCSIRLSLQCCLLILKTGLTLCTTAKGRMLSWPGTEKA